MSTTNKVKIFQRALARRALYASTWFITRLSLTGMRFVTHFFFTLGYPFLIKQRRITRESLQIAFGCEKSDAEIRGIARKCFENVGKMMIEMIYFMDHPELIRQHVSFEGKEHLDGALKKGKGVIAVSAHFGNFPLMLLRLAQDGYTVNAIIRRTRDQELEEYFQSKRISLGLNTIYSHPRKECVDTSLRVLRNNEFLFIPLDQNFGSGGGVFVDFFGQKAATATGPVVFAMRTEAPIVPVFVVQQKDGSHRVIIEPALTLEEKDDDKATIAVNTARITQIIERYIRKFPAEWGWMHRRWKTKKVD